MIDREDDAAAAAVIIYVSMATTGLAEPTERRKDYVQKLQCNERLSNKLLLEELGIWIQMSKYKQPYVTVVK